MSDSRKMRSDGWKEVVLLHSWSQENERNLAKKKRILFNNEAETRQKQNSKLYLWTVKNVRWGKVIYVQEIPTERKIFKLTQIVQILVSPVI